MFMCVILKIGIVKDKLSNINKDIIIDKDIIIFAQVLLESHLYLLAITKNLACANKLYYIFQLYNFGETVSVVFWDDSWKPESFYDKICTNLERNMHTLCLLGQCSVNMFKTIVSSIFKFSATKYVSTCCVQT